MPSMERAAIRRAVHSCGKTLMASKSTTGGRRNGAMQHSKDTDGVRGKRTRFPSLRRSPADGSSGAHQGRRGRPSTIGFGRQGAQRDERASSDGTARTTRAGGVRRDRVETS